VADIAAGGRHTMFITTCKRLFACGLNESGQLGTGPDVRGVKKTYEPKAVLLNEPNMPV
jgi:alpha-tubulin suppressor-like RCC1 family protein